MKICCTVCEREMDFTKDESQWVTTPVGSEDAYACSSLCALRLGHTIAKEEYKTMLDQELGASLPSVPPPCVQHQPVVN